MIGSFSAIVAQAGSDDVLLAQNIFWGIIAAIMVFSAFRVVTTKNIVHAALFLVVVLAGVAAQFIMLGAEFVGVTQVLVYIGAVIVLFLFGIMLTRAKIGDEERANHDNIVPALLTAVMIAAVMCYAVVDWAQDDLLPYNQADSVELAAQSDAAYDEIRGTGAEVAASLPNSDKGELTGSATLTRQVSDTIFGDYLVAFEAVSVLLLAALIGAIVLARKE